MESLRRTTSAPAILEYFQCSAAILWEQEKVKFKTAVNLSDSMSSVVPIVLTAVGLNEVKIDVLRTTGHYIQNLPRIEGEYFNLLGDCLQKSIVEEIASLQGSLAVLVIEKHHLDFMQSIDGLELYYLMIRDFPLVAVDAIDHLIMFFEQNYRIHSEDGVIFYGSKTTVSDRRHVEFVAMVNRLHEDWIDEVEDWQCVIKENDAQARMEQFFSTVNASGNLIKYSRMKLGEGVSANVYTHDASNFTIKPKAFPLVVKVFGPLEEMEDYEREYRYLRRMHRSSYVIRVVNFYPYGVKGLVLERWGINLSMCIQQCRKDLEVIASIAMQMIHGLSDLQQEGIVHADIKPQNILIDPSTHQIKFADFGLSVESGARVNANSVVTRWYRSPELIRSGESEVTINHSVDWWSTGCVIGEIITGRELFLIPEANRDFSSTEEYFRAVDNIFHSVIAPDKPDAESPLLACLARCVTDEVKERALLRKISSVVQGLLRINPERRKSPTEALAIFA